jgi:ATPase family AAA domain-containing protein 3A/B
MSWLFGVKKQPAMPEGAGMEQGGPGAGQASGDQQLTKAEKKAMEAYRFDSSALERAAQAAKTLETSSKYQAMKNDVTIAK